MAEGKRLVIFGDSIAKGVTYQDGRYHLCSEHNFDALAQKYGIEYAWTSVYPTPETVSLAAGYDAISFTPCQMDAALLAQFYELGVRYLAARSIGYDHIDWRRRSGWACGSPAWPMIRIPWRTMPCC